jgi:hypothetical protein
MRPRTVGGTITIAVLLATLAACSSSSRGLSPASTSPSTTPSSAAPRPSFDIGLDDGGLTLPPGPTPAGIYRVSFEDRRTHRGANEHAQIRFRPSGPEIELDEVSAGHSDEVTLLQNLIVYLAIDDVTQNVPIENQLDVRPTPRYSTPVT